MGAYKNETIIAEDDELIKQHRTHVVYEPDTCPSCQGWGAIDDGNTGMKERCPDCDGEGSITSKRTR
jgi:DnaJ-class molecular chaperone